MDTAEQSSNGTAAKATENVTPQPLHETEAPQAFAQRMKQSTADADQKIAMAEEFKRQCVSAVVAGAAQRQGSAAAADESTITSSAAAAAAWLR